MRRSGRAHPESTGPAPSPASRARPPDSAAPRAIAPGSLIPLIKKAYASVRASAAGTPAPVPPAPVPPAPVAPVDAGAAAGERPGMAKAADAMPPEEFLRAMLGLKKRHEIELDVHISLKHNYVYMVVGKAASSTVTYHLQCAEYRGTSFTPGNVNRRHLSPHIAPFQLDRRRFISVMTGPRFRRVTFVRNPYTRLLSCYLHRIVGAPGPNPSKKALLRARPGVDLATLSFPQFIDIITAQANSDMERHWAMQHDAVLYPLLKYDFIGRQETLVEDMLKLEALLFGEPVFDRAELGSVNKAPMQTGSASKLRAHYPDAVAAKVADRYALDFETFGYSKDLADAL